ncbi:polysaccharide deacetylase family protein [Marinobacter sp. DY40_1A1]|uniref:polysaccharide deacetylase family protein n=1 Tax=Marinobacter sp. DY40_1A1 TaxID=2583229 RepID=UPI00190542C9|nr:polysaccharide deacetylase family protein [Marinobacter sp. DY40_1A1]MBK1885788.1 polysaccharide deacetylase family protein [Marinobacter sp. DY40_1A1]
MNARKPWISAVLLSLFLASFGAKADLVVLQYHHISESTPPSTSTSVSLFNAQLDMITELGLEVVDLYEATKDLFSNNPSTGQRIAITFDDAYESVYSTGADILQERGLPYTIFVDTAAIGKHGYMTWGQLKELSGREGVSIANHTAGHGHLARKPGEAEADWIKRTNRSLDTAQAELKRKLGTDLPVFAYPYGEFDEALEAKVSERGWYGFGQQSGAIGPLTGKTRLPRFPMANTYGQLNGLKDKLNSKAFPLDTNQLPDGIVSANPPTLSLPLVDDIQPARLTCFASGMGRIDFKVTGNNILIKAPKPFNSRRFRYNCTHPAKAGGFYWLSQQWLDLSKPED